MARKKEFDPNHVLSKAVDIFWRQGYAQTSLADLVKHLEINRFSLYSTFGDKRSLYLQALNYYIDHHSSPKLNKLMQEGSSLVDLKNYFVYFSQLQYQQTSGCFVQNAIVELALSDADVSNVGQRLYQLVKSSFLSVLHQAQQAGEIDQALDIESISHFLLLQSQGIRVLGKAKQYKVMEDAMRIIYNYLDTLSEPNS